MAFREFANLPKNVQRFRRELYKGCQQAVGVVKQLGEKSTNTQRACTFLATATVINADAALLLADAELFPPALSLLRTCLEAQARANYVVSLNPSECEQKARDFNDLTDFIQARECEDILALIAKDGSIPIQCVPPDCAEKCRRIVSKAKLKLADGETFKSRIRRLEQQWSFSSVTQAMRQKPKHLLNQPVLEGVEVYWRSGCLSVHASPASLLWYSPDLNLIAEIWLRTSLYATISLVLSYGGDPDRELGTAIQLFRECYQSS
jgi:hypothetical protein